MNIVFQCHCLFKRLKDIEKPKQFGSLPPESPPGLSLRLKTAKTIALKHFFPFKTQSSSKKRTLVKVRG